MVKIDTSSEKCSLKKSSRNEKQEKFIQCSLEVFFKVLEESSKIQKSKQNYFIINTVNYVHLVIMYTFTLR